MKIREIYVAIELADKISSPLRRINANVDSLKSRIARLNDFVQEHKKLLLGLGAGLTALGYGGFRVLGSTAKDFERALAELQARTGLHGAELRKYTALVKNLARTNADSIESIAEVLTILRQRFGDTGKQTREIAQAILDFAKITGIDAVRAADSLAVTMKAFQIPASRTREVVDVLIAAQQRFGVHASRLVELMFNNSAALKVLGLRFSEAVGLLAAMEASGVNVSRALIGLRQAATKFESPADFRKALIDLAKIENITLRAKKATEIFGAYAGPGIARILEGGIKALNKFMLSEKEVAGVSEEAAKTIDRTLSEQLGILKNNLALVALELGKALLPFLKRVVLIVKTLANAFQALPAPVKSAIALFSALAVVFGAIVGPILVQVASLAWLYEWLGKTTLGVGLLSRAFALLRTAVLGFNLAILTNPVVLAITGIITALLLLQHAWVHNWAGIRDKTIGFVKAISAALAPLIQLLQWVAGLINKIEVGLPALPAAAPITAMPTPTTPTTVTHVHNITVPKIEIHAQGDEEKIARVVKKVFTQELESYGI